PVKGLTAADIMPWFAAAPRPKTGSMMDATRTTARYDARRTRHHATALAGCLDRLAARSGARVGPGAHLRLAVGPAPDLVALHGDGGERASARALRLGAAQSRPARPGRHCRRARDSLADQGEPWRAGRSRHRHPSPALRARRDHAR